MTGEGLGIAFSNLSMQLAYQLMNMISQVSITVCEHESLFEDRGHVWQTEA